MAEKRKVRGLLNVISAEGVEWELDRDTLHGLGLGASTDAVRWAQLGRELELNSFVKLETPKKGRGQPKKAQAVTNDVLRAMVLYQAACAIREEAKADVDARIEMPLFKLVSLATEMFPTHGLFEKPKATNKMYECVKRGREICGIDEYWRGKPFLEIAESIFISD